MPAQNVPNYGNENVIFGALEPATVETVLNKYFSNLTELYPNQQLAIVETFHSMTSSVSRVSPDLVQHGDIQSVIDLCTVILNIQNNDHDNFQELLNSLNLCVVGLGTKVKDKIYA